MNDDIVRKRLVKLIASFYIFILFSFLLRYLVYLSSFYSYCLLLLPLRLPSYYYTFCYRFVSILPSSTLQPLLLLPLLISIKVLARNKRRISKAPIRLFPFASSTDVLDKVNTSARFPFNLDVIIDIVVIND